MRRISEGVYQWTRVTKLSERTRMIVLWAWAKMANGGTFVARLSLKGRDGVLGLTKYNDYTHFPFSEWIEQGKLSR